MTLPLSDCLHQARSIPCFNGSDDYTLINYLKDMEMVLSLTSEIHQPTVKSILTNKVRGKALRCVEKLISPTYDQIIQKLKQEFGVKTTFFSLRTQAMNVRANNIDQLHQKLSEILHDMNSKFHLEGSREILYMPMNNERMIFDAYIHFLPSHIKTLLIQNQIQTISDAYNYFVENNILNDIVLKTSTSYVDKSNRNDNNNVRHIARHENKFRRNDSAPFNVRNASPDFANQVQRENRPGNPFRNTQNSGHSRRTGPYNDSNQNNNYNRENLASRGSNQQQQQYFNRESSGNIRRYQQQQQQQQQEPPLEQMDVDNIQRFENFRLSPSPPTYP